MGACYLVYLAWAIARSAPPDARTDTRAKPFTFLQAAAFQWVNPKAWAVGAIATYAPHQDYVVNVLLIAGLFGLVNGPSIGVWTVTGTLLRRWLDNPATRRAFNIGMALLLIASLVPILLDVKGAA